MGDWLGDAARRASARGRINPRGPRILTGADLFGMTPAQVRRAQGIPPVPSSPDFGGGSRGTSAASLPEPTMDDILREAGALKKERKASRQGF